MDVFVGQVGVDIDLADIDDGDLKAEFERRYKVPAPESVRTVSELLTLRVRYFEERRRAITQGLGAPVSITEVEFWRHTFGLDV